MHDLPKRAYVEMYGHEPAGRIEIRYHAGFKGYNARVRKHRNDIEFSLSKKFSSCEPEIQIGVMQFLFNRLNKTKVKTDNIDMYNAFLKHMSDLAPVTKTDPYLEESFGRVNNEYLNGLMSKPNLVWGNHSVRLLGTYTYATDTIMISSVLRDAPQELLDSVMYHEMLHKKHKFSCSAGGRTHSHTKAFREEEKKYSVKDVEARLQRFLRGARYRKILTKAPEKKVVEKQTFLQRVMGWKQ